MILDSVEERVDIRRACWWWNRLKHIGVRWNDRTDGFIKDWCQPCWFVAASNQMAIELEDVALSICFRIARNLSRVIPFVRISAFWNSELMCSTDIRLLESET